MIGRTLLDIDMSAMAVILLTHVIRAWLSYRDVGSEARIRELYEIATILDILIEI